MSEAIKEKVKEYADLKKMMSELSDLMEGLEREIKAAMGDSEALQAGEYKITWKPVTSSRIDAGALKKALPEVAERFTKVSTVRRFCVQ